MQEGSDRFAALIEAIRAELAALEAEDADAIEAATRDKTVALAGVQAEVAAGRIDRPALEMARQLNAEAALRAKAKMLGVERRLRAIGGSGAGGGGAGGGGLGGGGLGGAAGAAALTYGRDGRWARAG
jgi:hypothetical protein